MDKETTNKSSEGFISTLQDAAAGALVGAVHAVGFGLKVSIRVLMIGGALLGISAIAKKIDK